MTSAEMQTLIVNHLGKTGDTDFVTTQNIPLKKMNEVIKELERIYNFRNMRVMKSVSTTDGGYTFANPIPRYKRIAFGEVVDASSNRNFVEKTGAANAIEKYPNFTDATAEGLPKYISEYNNTESLVVSRGTTDTAVATTAFSFVLNDTIYTKAAVAAGTALAAATVPSNTWGLWRFTINEAGTFTSTGAAANGTTGYATESAAIAAIPSIPAQNQRVFYMTNKTKVGSTFIAGTDGLYGGSSGNVASATHYYAEDVRPIVQMLIRPTADAVYTLELHGYQYSPDLDDVVYATNWWTEDYSDVVLYGALLRCGAYNMNPGADFEMWKNLYDSAKAALIAAEQDEEIGGSKNQAGQLQ